MEEKIIALVRKAVCSAPRATISGVMLKSAKPIGQIWGEVWQQNPRKNSLFGRAAKEFEEAKGYNPLYWFIPADGGPWQLFRVSIDGIDEINIYPVNRDRVREELGL